MKHSKLLPLLTFLLLLVSNLAKAEDINVSLTNGILSVTSQDDFNAAINKAGIDLGDKTEVTLVFKLSDDSEKDKLTPTILGYMSQYAKSNYNHVTCFDMSELPANTLPASMFNGADKLTNIKLPALSSLSDNLFKGCASLKDLTIGNWSNTTDNEGLDIAVIPSGCFQNCGNLTNLYFKNIEKVEGWAFEGCTSMTTFPIKSCKEGTEVEIGQNAFNNTKLTGNIVLPEGIANIKGSSFASCKEMTTITLPTTIKNVDPEFDINSTALTHINMAGDNAEVNSNAYYLTSGGILYAINGSNLAVARCPIANPEPIKIPAVISEKTVTEIANKAFHDCAMQSVELQDGLLKIGDAAFINCKKLTELNIPKTVTEIATNFVNECSALAKLTVASGNPNYYTVENITYTKSQTDGYYNIFRIPEAAEITNGTLDLSEINDAVHVTGVGSNAFYHVKNAETIKLPDAVSSLADECFKGCGLKTFYVPKSLTEDGFGASPFSECQNLTEFAPPSEGESAIELDHFYVDNHGILYNKAHDKLFKVPNNYQPHKSTGETEDVFDVYHFVKEIQGNAFEGVKNIKTVNFAQGIKKVPHRCFYNATSVEKVLIPNSITEIGQDAFAGSGVKDVIMLTTCNNAPKSQNNNYNSFWNINANFKIHLSETSEYSNLKSNWVKDCNDFVSTAETEQARKDEEYNSKQYGWASIKDRIDPTIKHRSIFENSASIAGFTEVASTERDILNDADKSNNLTAKHYDYITLYRDFCGMKDDEYASLALPVDVTKATFIAAFGADSKVWAFDGRKDMTLHFKSVDISNMQDNALVIKKGIAILIRPEYKENSYLLQMNLGGESREANAIAIDGNKATSYISDTESDNEETIVTTKDNINYVGGKKEEGVSFKYGFYATYQKKSNMPAGTYYMLKDGSFKYAVNSLWMKGLRGFIHGNDDAIGGNTQALAKLSFDGFTTSIDDIVIDGNDHKTYNIYNASGQLVRKNATSTEGLAKGIYIMNGKKVIIR